jgi:hypothetical protein
MTLKNAGKRARQKGKEFQKAVTKLICNVLSIPEQDVHSCVGGITEEDIQMSSVAKAKFPFHIECKNTRKTSPREWITQAEKEAGSLTPLVVFKLHYNSTPYVMLRFEEFLNIWKDYAQLKEDLRSVEEALAEWRRY